MLDYIPEGITLLPNTSGARNAEEAVRIARLAREVCHTDFVKVEIEHETKYLLPDNAETIRATEMLAKEGFVVMPYMFPDPIAARQLEEAGAAAVMPLGSLIGSIWACACVTSSKSSSPTRMCRSSSTLVSAVRARPAMRWRWVRMR